MHNDKDFRKIDGGRLGAINFNNMIPVPDEAIIPLRISNEQNQQYRRLLQNQYNAILSDWESIQNTAETLHSLLFMPEAELSRRDRSVKSRCCNLPLLESVYNNWQP